MKWLLASLLALAPVQALALSCLPWGVENAYLEAQESKDGYFVVRGRLSFDEALLPKVNWDRQHEVPAETRIPAEFTGTHVGTNGQVPIDTSVELQVHCAGPWCPKLTSGKEYLGFFKHSENRFSVVIDPCGGMLFAEPDKKMMRRLRRCLSGGRCEAAKLP